VSALPVRSTAEAVRRAHSAVANAIRWSGPDSPEALNAQCSLRAAVMPDLIARSLDEGLLTDAHRRDLAALLTGGAR
jgi:hypothetical protein